MSTSRWRRALARARAFARAVTAAWPRGAVGAILLIAACECAFRWYEIEVLNPWNWEWRFTGAAASSKEARASEVLCFGDSLVKMGVLPRVLEWGSGRPAYNLAVPMGQAASSYFLLRRALDAGARPSGVLIDAAPAFLAARPTTGGQRRQWPQLLTTAESLDLAWSARDPGFFAEVTAARLLRTLRAREEIRNWVQAVSRGEAATRRHYGPPFWRNARVNRGAYAMPARPFHGNALEVFLKNVGGLAFLDPDPVNLGYLHRFLDLADARGVRVFFLLAPMAEEVQEACERSGFTARQTAFVASLRERHPNLTVLDARRSHYGRTMYVQDPLHLSHLGAAALSADVAPVLARALAGEPLPRWVELPAARKRRECEMIAVEDLDESAQALRRRWQKRR
jgi:hypothetical protein